MTKQIEPFNYQKRTNIEEHNQLVDKVNEIVDVINNTNLETIGTDIDNLKTRADKTDSDLASVQAKDIVQDSEIADLKPRVAMAESEITNLRTRADKADSDLATVQAKDITQDSEIDGITKSLVSDVIMSDGTTMGSVQVSIEREDGALITSKNYKWGRDIGIRLEAGTQAGYVKAVIDLSDGTVLESNEYRIVEVLESDIYVTAITLVADQTNGTLGGNISYSNGTTQTINTVSVPTAPGVTTALESLQSRMTAVEQKNTTQDGQITALDARVKAIEDTPGVGQFDTGKLGTIAGSTTDGRIKAESDGTGSVNGWGVLKDRVTSAEGQIVTVQGDVSNINGQISTINSEISGIKSDISSIKTKNSEQDTAINGKVSISQGVENSGKALVVGEDGNISPAVIGGEKTIYTGPISDLISFDTSNNAVIVNSDFEIHYLRVPSDNTYRYLLSANVKKATYTNANVPLGLGYALYNGGKDCYISVKLSNHQIKVYPFDSTAGIQLTDQSIPSNAGEYYILYK